MDHFLSSITPTLVRRLTRRRRQDLAWLAQAHCDGSLTNIEDVRKSRFGQHATMLIRDEVPLSYLIGTQEFLATEMFVHQGVLLPRDATEVITAWVAALYGAQQHPTTSSSLAPYVPKARVLATSHNLSASENGDARRLLRRLRQPLRDHRTAVRWPLLQAIVDLGSGSGCFGGSLAHWLSAANLAHSTPQSSHPVPSPLSVRFVDLNPRAVALSLSNAKHVWGADDVAVAGTSHVTACDVAASLPSSPTDSLSGAGGSAIGSLSGGCAVDMFEPLSLPPPYTTDRGSTGGPDASASSHSRPRRRLVARGVVAPLQDTSAWWCVPQSPATPSSDLGPSNTLIVSNPPYIPTRLMPVCDSNVLKWEPHLALRGGRSGFDLVKEVLMAAQRTLGSSNGADGGSSGGPESRCGASALCSVDLPNVVIEYDERCSVRSTVSAIRSVCGPSVRWWAVLGHKASHSAWIAARVE